EDALDVLEESGRIRRGPGSAADVVIAPGAAGADQVRAGRAVIVLPPATPLELAAANQRLAGAGIPWRFGTPRPGEGRLDPASSELAPALSGVRLREVYQLEPRGEDRDTTLIRLTDGESWAVSGSTDAGRYVILATPLTGEASTIPTSEAMLPLLDRAIGGWAADVPAGGGYHPGDVATLPPGDSLAAPETATPGTPGSTYRFTTPGVYRVMRDGEPVAAYAVNPPAAETDLTRLRGPQVVDALSGHVVRTAAPEDWRNAIYSERLGLEISWLLLVLALALLAVEQALAAAGARHHGARVGQNGSDRYARENAPAREI
ncbi:MAG TPA: hypothetical protein VK966_09170, partial [Longimicrobiales bacterium]|nr:hypothetical protein [Longimicrobiales bacterium]